MFLKFITLSTLVYIAKSDPTAPGIERFVMTEGVKSRGYQVVYGDEDLVILNQAVSDAEKHNPLKEKMNLLESIRPLAAQDVKCLMSVDRHCSTEMRKTKGVLVEAIKNDCEHCTPQEKDNAGKVAASMMAHDPAAWKLFLTRCVIVKKSKEKQLKASTEEKEAEFRLIGEPDIITSKSRYIKPGMNFKVRVKRYSAEKIL